MADNLILTKTELANRIPTLIANETLGKLGEYLNLINTVNVDYSDALADYGETISIIKRGTLTSNSKNEDDNVTLQKPTESKVDLKLDKYKEVTIGTSDLSRIFSKAGSGDRVTPAMLKAVERVLGGYAQDASMVLAEDVEHSLGDLYALAGSSINAGNAVDLADLRAARRAMITNKVPMNEPIYGYMDEYAIEDLPLTDASVLGTNRPVVEGSIAKLGGIDLFETQAVRTSGSPTVYHDMVYTKDAIALAVRPMSSDAEIWGGAKQFVATADSGLSIRVTTHYNANGLFPQFTMDILWGVKVIRSEHLIDMYHTNA